MITKMIILFAVLAILVKFNVRIFDYNFSINIFSIVVLVLYLIEKGII